MATVGSAATHYKEKQFATLLSIDKKNKTIAVRNDVYKLRQGVKIHEAGKKFVGLSSLTPGVKIEFLTRKNRRSGQVEISEIWIQRE